MRVPEDFIYYLAMHKDCTKRRLAQAEGIGPEELEISSDLQVLQLRKMVYAVLVEAHRMKAFTRLKPLGKRVLWGYIKPRHRIGGHICRCLARRNPGLIVVLGNSTESQTAFFWQGTMAEEHSGGLKDTLDRLSSALEVNVDYGDEMDDRDKAGEPLDDIWQTYYMSQYCPERKNLRAFRQRMPARDQRSAGLRLVEKKSEMTLEDFISEG